MRYAGKQQSGVTPGRLAVEGTRPQGSTADGHDSRESAKAAGVKAEQNRRYDNKECFVCGK